MSAISEVVQQVSEALMARQLKLATAESCTGGWVAKICTDLAGSSAWFEHGVVSYSNEAKMRYLDVPPDLLKHYGAVSEPVVKAMVEGLLQVPEVDVAVSISGIAGPGGGSAEKPVGLVWFGWGVKGEVSSQSFVFNGDRNAVREQAVMMAMSGILQRI